MTMTHISKKDLVTSIKCFLFQPHGAALSHILSLRHRDKWDGWFNPIYPCRQEINVPLPCGTASSIMDYMLGFPQATASSHVGTWFSNTSLDLSFRWQIAPPSLSKPQPCDQTEDNPQPHPLVASVFLGGLFQSISNATHWGPHLGQSHKRDPVSCSIQWWARAWLEITHLKYTWRKSVKK